MLRILLLIALCLPLTVTAQGQWKWRDAQGRIQFSDRPPPQGTPDKDILSRPINAPRPVQVVPIAQAASAAASAAAPAASTPQERAAASERARKAAENDAKTKAQEQREAQARAENCRMARQQLAALEAGVRVATINERGERVFLDDSQRQQEIRKTQAVIAADCK